MLTVKPFYSVFTTTFSGREGLFSGELTTNQG